MAQGRGTRRALLKPHTLFCGCCCSLKSGVLTGCSLFIMMYGTALITESFSARRSPDPALAQSFCELEDLEYRAAYNACYGMADVCVCDGGSPCVFHKAERQVELAAVLPSFLPSFLTCDRRIFNEGQLKGHATHLTLEGMGGW